MATAAEAIGFLLPNGEYVLRGENFEDLEILSKDKVTKEQFLAAFDLYDEAKKERDLKNIETKKAILDRLGITAEEAALLLK